MTRKAALKAGMPPAAARVYITARLPPHPCTRRFEVEEVQGGCRLALKRTLITELSQKER